MGAESGRVKNGEENVVFRKVWKVDFFELESGPGLACTETQQKRKFSAGVERLMEGERQGSILWCENMVVGKRVGGAQGGKFRQKYMT